MYLKVRRACAVAALIGGAIYLTVLWVASVDNSDSITLPTEFGRAIVGAISTLIVVSLGGWLIEQSMRAAIERDTRRVVREVVAKALAGHSAEVAATTRAVTIAECRLLLQQDVAEVIEAGLKRAERRGMVREAVSRAGVLTGPNGATVHSLYPGEA